MANDGYNPQQARTQQMPAQHARQSQQQVYQQPQYQQQYQQRPPQYQQQPMRIPHDVTTTGEWVLNLFLVAIPILGLILLFVWAFGSGTAPSKKNWARANLVWILIAIILSIVAIVASMALGIPVQDYWANYWKQILP